MRLLATSNTRLPRFHWLTWATVSFVALSLILIILPGEYCHMQPGEETTPWEKRCSQLHQSTYNAHAKDYNSPSISSGLLVFVVEHGWPRPWLARALVDKLLPDSRPYRARSESLIRIKSWFRSWGGSEYISVSWSNLDNWPFAADGWIIDPVGVLVDSGLALALLLAVGTATQWWVSRHRRAWRFYLLDLLGAMTAIGILLGIYTHHAHIREREGLATWPLQPPGFYLHRGYMTASQDYCGPVWLRKLAGSEYFPQLFHHVNYATITRAGRWRECYGELGRFPYIHTVYIHSPLPVAALPDLERCPRLKHLDIPLFRSKWQPSPPEPDTPILRPDDLWMLGRLRLESVTLAGDRVYAQHIELLASLPTIKRIKVTGISVTEAEIEAIHRKHPDVTIVVGSDWAEMFSGG